MTRRVLLLILLPVAGLALAVSALRSHEPAIPPPPPPLSSGVSCLRQGGEPSYCRCLDHLESARGRPAGPGLPSMELPAVRYALRHHRQYPIINADTPRCLQPPRAPSAPVGSPA